VRTNTSDSPSQGVGTAKEKRNFTFHKASTGKPPLILTPQEDLNGNELNNN
jgi:hypothetical protein